VATPLHNTKTKKKPKINRGSPLRREGATGIVEAHVYIHHYQLGDSYATTARGKWANGSGTPPRSYTYSDA